MRLILKNKRGLLIGLLLIIIAIIVGFVSLTSKRTSESSKLGQLNIEYQETWRVLDSNMTSYDTIVGMLTEQYKNASEDSSFYNEYMDLHNEVAVSTDKLQKYHGYLEFKRIKNEVNERIDKLGINNEDIIIRGNEEGDKLEEQISEQVKQYNDLVSQYNKILGGVSFKVEFDKKLEPQKLLE